MDDSDPDGVTRALPRLPLLLPKAMGIVTCVRASNGEKVFESRVRGAKSFWSSPWSDGHVYALDASGNTHIFTPGDELETLAVNPLDQMSWASPALSDGNLFLRTIDHLYCIDGQPH